MSQMASSASGEEALTLENLVTVDIDIEPYVLTWPDPSATDGSLEAFVLVVMRRRDGVMLAVPNGSIPQATLDAGLEGQDEVLGLSYVVEVPSVVLDGGNINPTGELIRLVLVDCSLEVLDRMRVPRAFEDIAYSFDPDSQFALPEPGPLLEAARLWVESADPDQVLMFYSAVEATATDPEEDQPFQASGAPTSKARGASPASTPGLGSPAEPKRWGRVPPSPPGGGGRSERRPEKQEKQKRPTTASLAASLQDLMLAIPKLNTQVQALANQQRQIENRLAARVPSPDSALVPISCRSSYWPFSPCQTFDFTSKNGSGSQPWFIALPSHESARGAASSGRGSFSQGGFGPVSSSDKFGESDCPGAERSFGRLRSQFFDWYQRLCRKSQVTGGVGQSERIVLCLSDELDVKKNAPDSSGGGKLSADDGQRHLRNQVPGEVRGLRTTSRLGTGSISGDAVDGLLANGKHRSSTRQCRSSGSDAGTGGDGQWKVRSSSCTDSPGRHSVQCLRQQEPRDFFKVQKLRSTGRSALDHHGHCLPERIGHYPEQAPRDCRRSSFKSTAQFWRRRRRRSCAQVQSSAKEEGKGERFPEPATSSCRRKRGSLVPDLGVASHSVHPLKAEIDFLTWCICLPRWIASCRTRFSWFLKKSFRVKRCDDSLAPTTAFPLPAPDLEVFQCSGPGLSKKRLFKIAKKRVLHIIVMIVNQKFLLVFAL